MALKILKYPNASLRKKARKVKDFKDPKLRKLILDMIKTMEEAKGVGLAASQIGLDLKICVIDTQDEILTLINPEIKSYSRKKVVAEEGCLSFPGEYLQIERSQDVKVRAMNVAGEKIKIKAEGMMARIIQHEIDHLNGVLIIDRAKRDKKI